MSSEMKTCQGLVLIFQCNSNTNDFLEANTLNFLGKFYELLCKLYKFVIFRPLKQRLR